MARPGNFCNWGSVRLGMALAAFYAGLILNVAVLDLVCAPGIRGMGFWPLVAGAGLWGVFLAFGVLWAPARLRMGLREMAEAVLGGWAGGFVWYVLAPAWAVVWFGYFTRYAQLYIGAGVVKTEGYWGHGMSEDSQRAVLWPWAVLVVFGAVRVRMAALVLLALPFAYHLGWAWEPGTWDGMDRMQGVALWMAPVLLATGGSGAGFWRPGLLGVVAPLAGLAGVAAATRAAAVAATEGMWRAEFFISYAGGWNKGAWWKVLLLALTLVAAGRYCVSFLTAYLGEWRPIWVVFPAVLAVSWWSRGYIVDWVPPFGAAFVALAGVICGGYLARREFVFERGLGVAAWLAGCWFWEEPVIAWAVGFAGMGLGVKLCDWRHSMRG